MCSLGRGKQLELCNPGLYSLSAQGKGRKRAKKEWSSFESVFRPTQTRITFQALQGTCSGPAGHWHRVSEPSFFFSSVKWAKHSLPL